MSSEANDVLLEEKTSSTPSVFSASLLLTGTCIGAGMLAIPFVSYQAGLIPSLLMGFICWLFMYMTGLLFLEATLWLPDGANVLSISETFLGKAGKAVCGFLFLFLYYCLLVSYMDEGSALFLSPITDYFGPLSAGVKITIFGLFFGLLVLFGTHLVSRVNRLFVLAMCLSYGMLLFSGLPHLETPFLLRTSWPLLLFSAPTLFSAYGYHNIIPTLCTYMKRDRKKLQKAVLIGTAIPFVTYSLWQIILIGSVSAETLQELIQKNYRTYEMIGYITQSPLLAKTALFFAFFALTTSFLGVALSMVDFLADGLKATRTGWSRLWLSFLVFLPPGLFAAWYPGIFIEAIGFAGGLGEALINGLMPIAVVWIGRYIRCKERIIPLPGGRLTLLLLASFTFLIMALELHHIFF
jgi:tyrosine-specific transport protein